MALVRCVTVGKGSEENLGLRLMLSIDFSIITQWKDSLFALADES